MNHFDNKFSGKMSPRVNVKINLWPYSIFSAAVLTLLKLTGAVDVDVWIIALVGLFPLVIWLTITAAIVGSFLLGFLIMVLFVKSNRKG